MGFDHERLTVYQRALEFVESAHTVRRSMPPRFQSLADQLDRSSVSIVLNIAEGAGEFSKREKARFYRIARRSATESAAMLDVVDRLNLAPAGEVRTGKSKLQEIVAMLVKLAKTMELAPANRPKAEGGKGENGSDSTPARARAPARALSVEKTNLARVPNRGYLTHSPMGANWIRRRS